MSEVQTANRKKKLLADIEKCKARIAAERDKLHDLIDEVDDICGCADDAIEQIDEAVQTLSQYL